MPPNKEGKTHYLGASGGNIMFIGYPNESSLHTSFVFWQLKTDFSGWSKLCSISRHDIVRGLPVLPRGPVVVFFHKGKEGEGDTMYFTLADKLFSYHLQNKTGMDLNKTLRAGWGECQTALPLAETIISMDQLSKNISIGLASVVETPPLGIVHRDTIRVQVSRQFSLTGQLIPDWVWSLGGGTEFLHIDSAKLQIIRLYTDAGQPIPEWVWTMRADFGSMS